MAAATDLKFYLNGEDDALGLMDFVFTIWFSLKDVDEPTRIPFVVKGGDLDSEEFFNFHLKLSRLQHPEGGFRARMRFYRYTDALPREFVVSARLTRQIRRVVGLGSAGEAILEHPWGSFPQLVGFQQMDFYGRPVDASQRWYEPDVFQAPAPWGRELGWEPANTVAASFAKTGAEGIVFDYQSLTKPIDPEFERERRVARARLAHDHILDSLYKN